MKKTIDNFLMEYVSTKEGKVEIRPEPEANADSGQLEDDDDDQIKEEPSRSEVVATKTTNLGKKEDTSAYEL